MKLFHRGTDAKPAEPAPAPAPATGAGDALAAAKPPAPPTPDLTAILDANVKEISEKVARLASNIEGQQQDRTGFEAKFEQMEDRMRKLSSLTEMITAQYNPFVGEAPREHEPLPSPEVGLAPPALSAPAVAVATPAPAPARAPEPHPAVVAAPAPMRAEERPPAAAPVLVDDDASPARLWAVRPSFEGALLMLGWADLLLKSTGSRENLLELVSHYHNLGWLGDPARDQLLAYAEAIALPQSSVVPADWRASADVHEKSLLYIEKLRAIGRTEQG